MPSDDGRRPAGLPCEDLARLLEVAARAGIRKVKLLGGEPLVRPDLPEVIRRLRLSLPRGDLSMITSGAANPARMAEAFAAGLDRANLTIHGWSLEAFARRGGTAALHARRHSVLDLLLARDRKLKVNYVYGGTKDDADLGGLLRFATGRPMVVNVLNDLGNPEVTLGTVLGAVKRVHGPWERAVADVDPDSLDAAHLHWADGLAVEVKTTRLGEFAPWRHCLGCDARARCREGIFAIRFTTDGSLRLCMDRPDLRLPLAEVVRREGVEAGAVAWRDFIEEAM